jgi:sulfatase modifying factor 1
MRNCCTPARVGAPAPGHSVTASGPGTGMAFVSLPGGTFRMGSERPEAWPSDGERPVREITLSPFAIAPYAVTNQAFAEFVAATAYVTDAERYGWSFVFELLLSARMAARCELRAAATPWWCAIEGVSWRHPEGPDSSVRRRGHHPVVHVSYNDAVAYCEWDGCRLPTEAEWEYAARGGLDQARYPWGDEPPDAGDTWRCNIFQGEFPDRDTGEDGYRGTAPVDAYAANAYGLHNMVGNVWEWMADRFSARHSRRARRDPTGPAVGSDRVTRGGSYLCHDSYCNRYRTSARMALAPDSSAGNVGFRCARDAD